MHTKNGDEAIRADLTYLANTLLQYYQIADPPVPIERILENPPSGLAKIDSEQISNVIEHGMYSYAPRLAMARLLGREITSQEITKDRFGVDVSHATYADVKFFARCLLMPSRWIYDLSRQKITVEQMSDQLQVPSYAIVTRLVELGLQLPSTD